MCAEQGVSRTFVCVFVCVKFAVYLVDAPEDNLEHVGALWLDHGGQSEAELEGKGGDAVHDLGGQGDGVGSVAALVGALEVGRVAAGSELRHAKLPHLVLDGASENVGVALHLTTARHGGNGASSELAGARLYVDAVHLEGTVGDVVCGGEGVEGGVEGQPQSVHCAFVRVPQNTETQTTLWLQNSARVCAAGRQGVCGAPPCMGRQ